MTPSYAAAAATGSVAASVNDSASGLCAAIPTGTRVCSAYPPVAAEPKTGSPTANPVTSGPVASTTPETSPPKTTGNRGGGSPGLL